MRILAGGFLMAGLMAGGAAVHQQATPSVVSQVQADQTAPTKEKPRNFYAKGVATAFRTSDRCMACHVGMKTEQGDDYSIGTDWRASIMANSSRDPYWQGSIRRETMDHPDEKQHIENECSFCHMPAIRLADRDAGRDTHVFDRFPFAELDAKSKQLQRSAQDGVTCSVCHQVEKDGLGTDATFNGNVVVSKAVREDERPEYGPYDPDHGHQTIMHSSTEGYLPVHSDHTFGAKYEEGSANFRVSRSEIPSRTPQRTHRSRLRSTPTAAAEAGLKVLEASIQAQTFPIAVICDRKESARDIRPEHVSPTSSVRAPTGSPPIRSSSRGTTPEGTTGRTMRGGGVNAEGYFRARADSTCTRIVAAVAMANTFALYSPTGGEVGQADRLHRKRCVRSYRVEKEQLAII
jgi:hypothetical protein